MFKQKNIEQNFFIKFVGLLSRKGSKSKAKKIVAYTFAKLQHTLKKPLSLLLIRVWRKLDVFVEARKIRVRRNYHCVPFMVTLQRRILLALKWILNSALLNKTKSTLALKLYHEILLVENNGESAAFGFKASNNSSAQSNRANMHYRW